MATGPNVGDNLPVSTSGGYLPYSHLSNPIVSYNEHNHRSLAVLRRCGSRWMMIPLCSRSLVEAPSHLVEIVLGSV